MNKSQGRSLELRALLTDTLPYEVPIIFSNDKLHATLSNQPSDPVLAWVQKLYKRRVDRFSIAYNYRIAKGPGRDATLSIIHPLSQVEMAEFYERNSSSMLSFCSNEQFSLRRPASLASPFVSHDRSRNATLRQGVVQRMIDEGEPDVSHLTSFFAYQKYNLLGKFVESKEFARLERKFTTLRILDISKCFYHIYTHSVTWAVREKEFAKSYPNTYSFEARFDRLMQRCNYNETNGIVVGPEFSRIFAEIVLQSIDRRVAEELQTKHLRSAVQYDIRRYVDDYYVFANSTAACETVESTIRSHLEEFKLYLNDAKAETHDRPFVSNLSLANSEVDGVVRDVVGLIRDARKEPSRLTTRLGRGVAARLVSIRLILHRYSILYANISGRLLSRLTGTARAVLRDADKAENDQQKRAWVEVAIAILECALNVCAIDYRVRTTYSISQIAVVLRQKRSLFAVDQWERVEHLLTQELSNILRTNRTQVGDDFQINDSVESYNLLICGAEFAGADFVKLGIVTDLLDELLAHANISYFRFITLKFCFLKDQQTFSARLASLNEKVEKKLRSGGASIWRDTQHYLLLCDFLSSPDIPVATRRRVYEDLVGGKIPGAVIPALADAVGFVDWSGLSVEHLLVRKALRPVYSWG